MKNVILSMTLLGCMLTASAYNDVGLYYGTPWPCVHPGGCYGFYELVSCSRDNYSCKDGFRRVWSYRPLYYQPDRSELVRALNVKVCPNEYECTWSYSMDQQTW
ncbi:MAG: hypothetical protein M3R00_08760 [Pseudomonadota bacterium]|nr:hypothetical protein [Pseudomonadota bacterium]